MSTLSVAVCLALSARADATAKELGSPSFLEREEAQAQLLAIGGPALPAVNRAVASTDPEVARRAQVLVKDIGFRLDCARLLAGTPVRLDFTDAPLSSVLTALSKQSGYAVGVQKAAADPDKVTVTIQTGETTFWSAVEIVGKAAGLSVAGPGTDDGSVRYFIPDDVKAPSTSGEKIRAWADEVDTLLRASQTLDPQARAVLEVYRNDLRQYANSATAIEKTKAEEKVDRGTSTSLDRLVVQAENRFKAARNLFAAAGIRAPVGPGGRYPVILSPESGPAGAASAGIWVEPSATSPAIPQVGKAYSAGARPPAVTGPYVYLRVVPEPRIEWVRTTGLRVEFATDDGGRAVEPNLLATVSGENPNDDLVLLGGGGRVIRKSYVTTGPVRTHPFYASAALKVDSPAPAVLRELRGAIQGVVKAAPEEVAVRGLTVEGKVSTVRESKLEDPRQRFIAISNEPLPVTSASPNLTATLKQDTIGYNLSVSLQYSSDHFAPAGGSLDVSGRTTQLARVAPGQGIVIIEQYGSPRGRATKAESVYGLRVTDAEGRPFNLSGGFEMTRMSQNGTGPAFLQLSLSVTATEATKGPPVRIAWRASRLAAVEVPFALTNVPVVK